ncbi:putative phage DNA replication protein O [Canicola haemoglobinophilus]|uniref:Phage DNA replication protein O n=1 Tax=Canicola haemoglobinophilus TaxID=733 RepID=A0AB38H9M1_9PAST|nr:DNA replication protein [Canicola haemoglobinophilus]STO54424.1 putative phage DNA replication protein O [Canicola haemoglobinophilus]STO68958.1 putative phage DNA replication protein O [Canicola haemoglobinophilus]
MKASELLKQTGRSIAYRPKLAKLFGGVTAEIFFEQIFYWQDKAENEALGVYKTQAELEEETGLTRKEQETARRKLRERGVLIETHKRLEHRIYFKIDMEKLDELLATLANEQDEHSPMPERDIGDSPKSTFVNTLDYNTRLHNIKNINSSSDELIKKSAKADVLPEEQVENFDVSEEIQVQTQNQSPENSVLVLDKKSHGKKSPIKIDYQAVMDAYNQANSETGGRLPYAQSLTEKRKRAMKKLLTEHLSKPTLEYAVNYFERLFELLRPFHVGEGERGWRANFDWAIRGETVVKVREEAL